MVYLTLLLDRIPRNNFQGKRKAEDAPAAVETTMGLENAAELGRGKRTKKKVGRGLYVFAGCDFVFLAGRFLCGGGGGII